MVPAWFFTAPTLHGGLAGSWVFGGLPDSAVGKESACSAGDPGSIPGSGNLLEKR